jgi:P-type Ca2+ transporter type 2C
MIIMFALGLARGQAWTTLFDTAVALAIAAIPLALPMVVQVVLSLGSVELAKQKAIVKDLPSVETLGFTSAINSDKTGTLTMNQMTAVEVVDPTDRYAISGTGYSLDGKIHHPAGKTDTLDAAILPYVVASDAKLVDGKVVGDPTEGALLVLAHKAGLFIDGTREQLPRLATLPFDPSYKLMATFNQAKDASGNDVVRCFVKGAAPAVLARAATALANGASVPWDDALRQRAEQHVKRMEEAGLRVMAGAFRDLDAADFDPDGDLLALVQGLEMTSLVGMVDPPRQESKAAVADAQQAHIRVRMVTGDDVVTGAAIARQLGIPGQAILGADFAALPEAKRLERIDDIGVVGRVAPEHKVLLAETLKKKGHVVAMTGDGVNDAPAIKAADIGVAMGSGTEVAKNAGRMILSDDNFATIVYAVEQGRMLYDNLAKYIRFVLLELVAFVLTFLGATLLDIAAGQPFTPAQILWINFLVNAPFGVALGFDQQTPRLDEPPPAAARGIDPDPRCDDHLRPGRPVHRRRQPGPDRDRQEPLRQRQDRPVHGTGRLLPDARGRRLRGPQRERNGLRHRHLQQRQDEHHRHRRDRRGIPHHPGELHEPAPRHHPADRRAVGLRGTRRRRAAPRLGSRQADRAPRVPNGACGLARPSGHGGELMRILLPCGDRSPGRSVRRRQL